MKLYNRILIVFASVLVLTGETSREDAEGAQEADRPDFTVDSLDDIDRIMYR